MGSGVSHKEKREKSYEASATQRRANRTHDFKDEPTTEDVMNKRKKAGGLQVSDQIDTKLHFQECKNPMLVQKVGSIREAYQLTDETKTVISTPARLGFRTYQHEVNVGIPTKIYCDLCGTFIVGFQGHKDFYCCFGCRSRGRKFEICEACHTSGALEEVRKTALPQASPRPSPRPSPCSSAKLAEIQPKISGEWSAKITEGKSSRQEKRTIQAFTNGRLTGTSCSGAKLAGRFDQNSMTWTETHSWGEVVFKAELEIAPKLCRLSGNFSATDGGKGTFAATKQM